MISVFMKCLHVMVLISDKHIMSWLASHYSLNIEHLSNITNVHIIQILLSERQRTEVWTKLLGDDVTYNDAWCMQHQSMETLNGLQ